MGKAIRKNGGKRRILKNMKKEKQRRKSIPVLIKKRVPMSRSGYRRLSKGSKTWMQPFVYKVQHIKRLPTRINTKTKLFRWLFENLGTGFFLIHTYKKFKKTKSNFGVSLTRHPVKIEIIPRKNPDGSDGFFSVAIDTRTLARFNFWRGD